MKRVLMALIFLLGSASCKVQFKVDDFLDGPGTDSKSFVDDGGRPSGRVCTSMRIADTGYTASAGPAKYTDEPDDEYDYFVIAVERPVGNRHRVFYERKLSVDMVAPEKLDAPTADLVTYDAGTRTVKFDLGKSSFEYVLP